MLRFHLGAMAVGGRWAVAVAAVVLLLLGELPRAAAQPQLTAMLPVSMRFGHYWDSSRAVEWVNFTLTLERDTLFCISSSRKIVSVVANGTVVAQPRSTYFETVLRPGRYAIAVLLDGTGVWYNAPEGFYFFLNVTFPMSFGLGGDGRLYVSTVLRHGVAIAPYSAGGSLPVDFLYMYVNLGFPLECGDSHAAVAVYADKGNWGTDGESLIYSAGAGSTFPDNVPLTVAFCTPPVVERAIEVVDGRGRVLGGLPGNYSRVLVGARLMVQPSLSANETWYPWFVINRGTPLLSNATVFHFLNGSVVEELAFDEPGLYRWGVLLVTPIDMPRFSPFPFPAFNMTWGVIRVKRLGVNYVLHTPEPHTPEPLPFAVRLEGDLSRPGTYALGLVAGGARIGALATESVDEFGNVTTIGTYAVSESDEWYNVTLIYSVWVYPLNHPFVSRVYSLKPVAVLNASKLAVTVDASAPFLLASTRKVVGVVGGETPFNGSGGVYFVDAAQPGTYTVKLAALLTVRSVAGSAPVNASITVLDSEGNVVATGYGSTVSLELEPFANYTVVGTSGQERKSVTVYLTDDAVVTLAFTAPEQTGEQTGGAGVTPTQPAVSVPAPTVERQPVGLESTLLALLAVIAACAFLAFLIRRRRGLIIEMQL
jgi:hypothetical protein